MGNYPLLMEYKGVNNPDQWEKHGKIENQAYIDVRHIAWIVHDPVLELSVMFTDLHLISDMPMMVYSSESSQDLYLRLSWLIKDEQKSADNKPPF